MEQPQQPFEERVLQAITDLQTEAQRQHDRIEALENTIRQQDSEITFLRAQVVTLATRLLLLPSPSNTRPKPSLLDPNKFNS